MCRRAICGHIDAGICDADRGCTDIGRPRGGVAGAGGIGMRRLAVDCDFSWERESCEELGGAEVRGVAAMLAKRIGFFAPQLRSE